MNFTSSDPYKYTPDGAHLDQVPGPNPEPYYDVQAVQGGAQTPLEASQAAGHRSGDLDPDSKPVDRWVCKDNSAQKVCPDGPLTATDEAPHRMVQPSIPLIVIMLLFFSSAAQAYSGSVISMYTSLLTHISVVDVTRFWMFVGYVAWCQPVLGWISDSFTVFRERRRPLFMVCVTANVIIYCVYCFKPSVTDHFPTFVGVGIASQICTMGIYIPLNGLLVEIGRRDAETVEESTARMSSIMAKVMIYRSAGSLASAVLQVLLAIKLQPHELVGVTSILFFILIPLVVVTPRSLFLLPSQQSANPCRRIMDGVRLIRLNFDIRDYRSTGFVFLYVLLFVFFFTLMPDGGSAYYTYLFSAFSFPLWFYSLNTCFSMFGALCGASAFALWMDFRAKREAKGGKRTSLFVILTASCIAWSLGYATNIMLCTGFVTNTLRISAKVFVPIDSFFMSFCARFAFMPTIILAAEHAPKAFEATTFEMFSVASMGGGTLSATITSLMAQSLNITRDDYSPLWILLLICAICKLVPIPVAYVLPSCRTLPSSLLDEEDEVAVGDTALYGNAEVYKEEPLYIHSESKASGDTAKGCVAVSEKQ